MNKQTLISIIIVVVVVLGGLIALQVASSGSSAKLNQYDSLAKCLGEKGATFYGAFWCPHCSKQKKMFAKSAEFLPYVECSNPDGQGQTAVCAEQSIQSYPTWIFADGTRVTGEQSPEDLAIQTGCEATLPGNAEKTTIEEGAASEVVPN